MNVRLLELPGQVSKDIFEITDHKNRKRWTKVVKNLTTGHQITVHFGRILPVDSINKAIVLARGSKLTGLCNLEGCNSVLQIHRDQVSCPKCGPVDYLTVGKGIDPFQQQSTRNAVMSEKTATKEPVVVNIDEVKKYGELWTKCVPFNHASISSQAHVLIAVEPNRKLVFNTFDGALGKKSKDPIAELKLAEFLANTLGKENRNFHLIPSDLDKYRAKLEKDGYVKA